MIAEAVVAMATGNLKDSDPRACSSSRCVRVSSFPISGLNFSLKSILLLSYSHLEVWAQKEPSCFSAVDQAVLCVEDLDRLRESSLVAPVVFTTAHGHRQV